MVTETIQNISIAPALRIQAVPEEPVTDYAKNEKVYETNEFYPQNIYEISEITELRGVNTVIVGISPFQFNPVTKELVVITDIELEVEYIGGTKVYDNPKYRSPWFDPILKNALLNYEVLEDIEYTPKSSKNGTGCEYLIVIPNREDFIPYAEQILDFRTKQGIYTKIMSLEEMGVTNTAQIKQFFHNAYNTWDIPPVAVLLMGDHISSTNITQGIPAETISHPYSGSCITDNQYASLTSSLLPNMVFGRMAAENEIQMAVLVSKFLEYETDPCMEEDYYQNPITALGWQTERWFQICSEAVGGYWRNMGKTPVRINAIYQGTPGSIWSSNQNTSMVVNYFGPNGTGYIPATPSELGGWSGGIAQHVINAVNSGAFALQHRDHGFENGWGEPAFQSSHISQFNNVGKMTYVFTINCLTGKFNHYTPCFGEVFHRYTYQGQNAGCVGYLGPTEVSYSFVNDAYAWGMYDLYDPEFLPSFGPQGPHSAAYSGSWMPAFGNVAGKYFLAQSNWPYNTGSKVITYQMFTPHSDVFLRLFTEVPQTNNVSHAEVSFEGNSDFFISASEGTLIALTAEIDEILVILDVAVATGEEQTMTLSEILPLGTIINVVVTGQNYLRYEAEVLVIELCEKPENLSATVERKTATLTWDDAEDMEGILLGYNIYRDEKKINENLISGTEYLDENLSSGVYLYQVSSAYEHCEESKLTEEISVTICEQPTIISVTAENNTIIITWDEPESLDGLLLGFNLYRNEDKINDELLTETEYIDAELPDETYTYQVSALYVHCEESELSEGVEINYVGITDFQTSSYNIFPNPTTGNVTFEGDGLNRIEIYDIQGRKLVEYNNIVNNLSINVDKYDNGIYLVKMFSDNNSTITRRLVIIK
jgi:hypothetical protein